LVQIRERDENYPYPYEQTTFWMNAKVRWSPMNKTDENIQKKDLALYFASAGYYRSVGVFMTQVNDWLLFVAVLVVDVLLLAPSRTTIFTLWILEQQN
jgi:hypothetical protein